MPFKIAALATGPDPADWATLEELLSIETHWAVVDTVAALRLRPGI